MKSTLACTDMPNRQLIFGTDDLNHGMLKGAITDSSAGRCANAIKRRHCNTPSDRSYAPATRELNMAVQLV